MPEQQKQRNDTTAISNSSMDELEAQAVDKAKASADAAFRPAPSILNAPSAQVLLNQVDGPNLADYKSSESIFTGKRVPIHAGKALHLPIHVSTPGSIVEYSVELEKHDLELSIVAEREEGTTIVRVRLCLNCYLFVVFAICFVFA